MKTATLTWNSFYNYGTMLQAYALQKYLQTLGHDNSIIDDSSIVYGRVDQAEKENRPLRKLLRLHSRILRLLKRLSPKNKAFFKAQKLLCKGINEFKHNVLNVDYCISAVLRDESDYDVFICGSDQIWIPDSIEDKRREFYYAPFTNKKIISYAPSLGRYKIDDKYKRRISKLIEPIQNLSVREETGKMALQELTDKPVEVVVDPTLLLSEEEWKKKLVHIDQTEKYVLAYFLTPNSKFVEVAKNYAKEKNLRFYMFFLDIEAYGRADRLISGGPFEFLSYIDKAEMVFTDSFHGTIFATIFETPFYIFKRFNENSKENQNTRVENLLEKMGIEERLLDENSCNRLDDSSIDFKAVKMALLPYIESSKLYIQKSLNC